ncbi:MAG TPA: BolA family protein, partial [Gammaproteobacteria bacterium]|nr:BolA family protein [Gammaproteobacteria bacterium]
MSTDRLALIRQRLEQSLVPLSLEVRDDSARHAGHAGARGGGHYSVQIVSPAFAGRDRLSRHRLVYAALGELLQGE